MCRLPEVVAACSSFLCELAEERCTDLVSTLADLDGDDRHAAGTCVPACNFRPLFVTTRSFACRQQHAACYAAPAAVCTTPSTAVEKPVLGEDG
jgi:hypothetical protein